MVLNAAAMQVAGYRHVSSAPANIADVLLKHTILCEPGSIGKADEFVVGRYKDRTKCKDCGPTSVSGEVGGLKGKFSVLYLLEGDANTGLMYCSGALHSQHQCNCLPPSAEQQPAGA